MTPKQQKPSLDELVAELEGLLAKAPGDWEVFLGDSDKPDEKPAYIGILANSDCHEVAWMYGYRHRETIIPMAQLIVAMRNNTGRLLAALKKRTEALEGLLGEPHGCRVCDYGVLRKGTHEHDDDCPTNRARAALEEDETR